MNFGGYNFGPLAPFLIIRKQLVKMFDHRRTGTGWSDYRVRIRCLKYLDKSPSQTFELRVDIRY